MVYDLFFVSTGQVNNARWEIFKNRFSTARLLENVSCVETIKNKSFTKFFWVVWDDLVIADNFEFDYRVVEWDQQYTHVFRNGAHFDGVCIFNKHVVVSEKEFRYRFFANKKEIDITASHPKTYDEFYISSYSEYLEALETSTTDMFWVVWDDLVIADNFEFDYVVPKWDQQYTHVFRNGAHFDGVCIFNKHVVVSEKEFRYRFFANKKEIDITASHPVPYDRFKLTSYQDYTAALTNSTTDMFWAEWPELEIIDDSIFSLHVHNLSENHVFKNKFRNEEAFTNGLVLFSKYKKITEKEFDHRFLIEKKEHDKLVSKMKPYDIVFISYNEPSADANYNKLKIKFPKAKRVHGIKGIHNAHIEAARQVESKMFWVVDADADVVETFNFDYEASRYDLDTVHVWQSQNPINGLVYGYGGIKLLPTQLTRTMDTSKPDMTTSISSKFKAMPEISNTTAFNTDPFSTWKSAFRECVKLSSKTIDRQKSKETKERLDVWTSEGADNLYGIYAISGAKDGLEYGLTHAGNIEALKKINDFDWLYLYWKNKHG